MIDKIWGALFRFGMPLVSVVCLGYSLYQLVTVFSCTSLPPTRWVVVNLAFTEILVRPAVACVGSHIGLGIVSIMSAVAWFVLWAGVSAH